MRTKEHACVYTLLCRQRPKAILLTSQLTFTFQSIRLERNQLLIIHFNPAGLRGKLIKRL